MQLAKIGNEVTMTSLEIVNFINEDRGHEGATLRHDHFMVKVPKVLGTFQAPKFLGTSFYINGAGNEVSRQIYILPKREACLMAMSYSYDLQAKVFDYMTELENQAKKPVMPTTYLEALRAHLESEEKAAALLIERDEAIRTKAHISDKKTATAMATASAKSKEVERLKAELGRNKEHATVKVVAKLTGVHHHWQPLKAYTKLHNLSTREVPDEQYGTVKAWSAKAWFDMYRVDLSKLF